MANVGVLGAGSWGTALSVLLHDNGHEVTIWSIDQKEVEMLNTKREHCRCIKRASAARNPSFSGR